MSGQLEEQASLDRDPAHPRQARAARVLRRGLREVRRLPVALPFRRRGVELGSGGGYPSDVIPDVMTSDVLPYPTIENIDERSQGRYGCHSE
jgi:hypothetical protein